MTQAMTTFGANDAIPEKGSARYSCTLTDHTGAAINSNAVSAIVATLKSIAADGTEAVVNSRTAQSVLNTNGGTLGSGGAFTLDLGTLDTVAVGTDAVQRRRLTLKVTYTTGVLTHEVEFYIRNLTDIS